MKRKGTAQEKGMARLWELQKGGLPIGKFTAHRKEAAQIIINEFKMSDKAADAAVFYLLVEKMSILDAVKKAKKFEETMEKVGKDAGKD